MLQSNIIDSHSQAQDKIFKHLDYILIFGTLSKFKHISLIVE